MSFHAPSPTASPSPSRHPEIVWRPAELEAARIVLRRAATRLRYDAARLAMLREEHQRLSEDAKQLGEMLEPTPGTPSGKVSAHLALRRFVEKRRGIERVNALIDQLRADNPLAALEEREASNAQ